VSAATTLSPTSILDLPHGLHLDVPNATYHERILGLASKSTLDHVHRSPAHYRAELEATWEDTPALVVGTALHTRLFEPARFAAEYAVEPEFGDCRKTENKTRRDAWRKENEGRIHLSAGDDAMTRGMVASLAAHPLASRLFEGGQREVTLRWKDGETGIECKARADYYVPARRLVVDLKSTEDAREDAFSRSVAKWGYHRQDGFYREAFASVGSPIDHFVFVVVEKAPPYAVSVYSLDTAAIAKGYASIHADLRTLASCIATDTWPGYPTGIRSLSLPEWAK